MASRATPASASSQARDAHAYARADEAQSNGTPLRKMRLEQVRNQTQNLWVRASDVRAAAPRRA